MSECCFDKLSKHELNVKSPPSSDPNLSFFRKGIVGDWKNVFEPKHILKFKQEANEMLLRLGYEDSPDW